MTYIEARGLRKTYGAAVAMDGIDLQVEEGRILGLTGRNGASKTTALNAIVGLTPFEGQLNRLLIRQPTGHSAGLSPCGFARTYSYLMAMRPILGRRDG